MTPIREIGAKAKYSKFVQVVNTIPYSPDITEMLGLAPFRPLFYTPA